MKQSFSSSEGNRSVFCDQSQEEDEIEGEDEEEDEDDFDGSDLDAGESATLVQKDTRVISVTPEFIYPSSSIPVTN